MARKIIPGRPFNFSGYFLENDLDSIIYIDVQSTIQIILIVLFLKCR